MNFQPPDNEDPRDDDQREQDAQENYVRLVRLESALFALLPGTYYMDEPDGGAPTLLEQLQRMAEDAARYRKLVAPWTDAQGRPIHHGDTLRHPTDGSTFVAVRLPGYPNESDAWRAVYDGESVPSRLCLQIGDKGRAVAIEAVDTKR